MAGGVGQDTAAVAARLVAWLAGAGLQAGGFGFLQAGPGEAEVVRLGFWPRPD